MDNRIKDLLLAEGQRLFKAPPALVKFTEDAAVDRLLNDLEEHPHAFVIACIMDRQVKAEIAWSVPHRFAERLGTFAFDCLRQLNKDEILKLMAHPEPLHRFPDIMAGNIFAAVSHIDEHYGGVASRIWAGRPSSAEVVFRFLRFRGVGPKISTMAANILARDFKIPFSDHYSIDISVDRHIKRVLRRLKLVPDDATNDEIIFRARALSPEFPGLMDFPCWEIGRNWCRPSHPQCNDCLMVDLCPTAQQEAADG